MPIFDNAFPLSRIIPPLIPARTSMDEEKMQELMESIRKIGNHTPVALVRHVCEHQQCREVNHPAQYNDDRSEPLYEISAGHRRYVATHRVGRTTLRAMLWEPEELDLFAVRVSENTDVEAWNPADQAIFIAELWNKHQMPVEDMAAMLKRTVSWCDERYALLSGCDMVFNSLKAGEINISVAKELNKCICPACKAGGNPDECPCKNVNGNTCTQSRIYYLNSAVQNGFHAPLVKQMIYGWKVATSNPPSAPPQPTPIAEGTAPVENLVKCCLCGGDKDPWNLKIVYLHEWHVKQFAQQQAELLAAKL
jgi:ParB/RepB/Spo0J family partition protein